MENLKHQAPLTRTGKTLAIDSTFLPGDPETLLDSISDGFFALDAEGRVTYVNSTAEKQLSLKRDDLLGHVLWDLIPDARESLFFREAGRAIELGHRSHVETRFPSAKRTIDMHLYPDGNGGLAVYFRDVTDRRQLSDEIRQKESFYRLLVENAMEYAIFGVDLDGKITHWNEGAQRLLQYVEEEVRGRYANLIYTPSDNALGAFECEVHLARETGRAANERWHLRKDGSKFWGSGFLIALRDDGNLRGYVKIMRDNTDRERVEGTLRQYKDIFHFSQQGVAIGNPYTNCLEQTNPAFAHMHGFEPGEMEGLSILDLFPPKEHAAAADAWRLAEENGHVQIESVHLRKNGSEFPIFLDITAVQDENGHPLYRIVNATDITVRRAAESTIRQSEEQLRTITENLGVATWNWHSGRDEFAYQRNMAGVFGLQDLPRTISDVQRMIHPADLRVFEAAIQGAVSNLHSFDLEFRVVRPEGTIRWLTCQAAAVDSGGAASVIGLCLDITDRKKAELSLLESEGRFRTLADAAPDFIWISGPHLDRYYLNRPWLEFTGRSLSDELGHGWQEGIHEADIAHVRGVLKTSLEHCTRFQMQYRLRRHDGEYRWLLDKGQPRYNPDGTFLGFIGSCLDITEQKILLQREKAARQQAEEASRAKDEFLATVSHELRTPLNAILGWTSLLREGVLGEEDEAKALETIERNARAQAQIVEDILDIARVITGKLSLQMQPLDLVPLVQSSLQAVQLSAESKRIQLQVSLPSAAPTEGDPARLGQAVLNLLTNAIKFTAADGTVKLTLERAEKSWVLEVSDTGVGISKEFLPHVFDRFRQADASSTRVHGGLGLGLALVQYIAEGHHGTITAQSEGKGQGATFTLELPAPLRLVASHLQSSTTQSSKAQLLEGKAILVVEDAPDTADFVSMVLSREGAIIETADTVAKARDHLLRSHFDAVVCDLGLPEEDGYSLAKWVRAHDGQNIQRLPMLALTAFAGLDVHSRTREAGFQAYLAKPFEVHDLLRVLVGLVRH